MGGGPAKPSPLVPFEIPRNAPTKSQETEEMLRKLKAGVESCQIIQKAKRQESIPDGSLARDKVVPSFMKSYMKDSKVYDHEKKTEIAEPRVPVRPSEFPDSVKDHAPMWWGVRTDVINAPLYTWEEHISHLARPQPAFPPQGQGQGGGGGYSHGGHQHYQHQQHYSGHHRDHRGGHHHPY
jgi:hypothetical protein